MQSSLPRGLTILVLAPLVTCEEAHTNTLVDPDPVVRGTIQGKLIETSADSFVGVGSNIVFSKDLTTPNSTGGISVEVSLASDQILRAFPPPMVLARLTDAANSCSADAVLVQHCAIKHFEQRVTLRSQIILPQTLSIQTGITPGLRPGSFSVQRTSVYIPGSISEGFSYIHTEERVVLSAALISAKDKKVLWSNRVLLRDRPNGPQIEKAIEALFAPVTQTHAK